jgi:hypothetical protein
MGDCSAAVTKFEPVLAEEAFPTPQSMTERWAELAAAIAKTRPLPAAADGPKGRLVVIGSGISHIDLTADAEAEIRSADYVFYCLYDKVSQLWISKLRPDAFDMTVLYNEQIERHFTYTRMAEAMLFHVRRGKKVVAVYYGHPGVFATPTHRAIKIARAEGHSAQMRPGISALDCLVADVGFDPALPGMVNYEATDMLLRRRQIDTSLHMVIWQVGVVGEFGFSASGFENRGYDVLVDALEEAYGADWEVTHYIAPQYVGVEPLIERHPIATLRDPEVRKTLSALSTFYIEPRQAVATDRGRSLALGSHPEQPLPPPSCAPDVTRYGPAEIAALRSFGDFAVSPRYRLPQMTPAANFMLALSGDLDMQQRYRDDPATVLGDPRFADLSDRARQLLAIPHPLAITAAIADEGHLER